MRAVVAVLFFVTAVHAATWGVFRDKQEAPDFKGILPSVSYAPFEGTAHPDVDNIPNVEKIRADMKKLAPLTRAIRLYSSTGGVELVPPIAAEFGIKVTLGAWIDKNVDRNEREIAAAIELAKRNSNVIGIVVGNETVFRGEQKVDGLIDLIKRVKSAINGRVPVTTGEIWNIWRDNPELGYSVDFIAAHVLPYWENFTDQQAVDQAVSTYQKLKDQFPGKRIVIAEFGWPSAGYNLKNAVPGPFEQAVVLRNFVTRAEAIGMDYNIVEAIDQPWKFFEGGVGPYWGILNAAREPKFAWTGPIVNENYWKLATLALLVGVLMSLPILRLPEATVAQALVLSAAANGVGAWAATVFAYWTGHYFVFGSAFALTLGLILLVPLVLIAMARIEEIAAIAFGQKPRRLVVKGQPAEPAVAATATFPKVSIHVPAYFEPPEMLKQTLDAVARLDYPNFECVVIINNTPDPEFWQPIQDHCRTLGERFKFIHAEKVQGFKAGALRIAMDRTAADAEIIGVIDADYVVQPDWLKDLVPVFADPRVGLVQAPQDHRDGDRSLMHYIMNGEYAGFFDIGMVQRNEANAIIVHGTMCLIRRAAMEMASGWAGDTICEDTDLGLAIIEHGWLSPDQRREFAQGWLNWLGAESLGVLVAILNLIWVPIVAFADIAIPDKILTLPIIAAFVVSLVHFVVLYRLRVPVKWGQMLGAMLAAMSVQWTVSRAVANGLITEHLAFARTSKGGFSLMSVEFQAFWEAVIGVLLLVGAVVLVVTNNDKQVREIYVFAAVLVLESLPFLSAVAIALLENSRLNSFSFWNSTGVRTLELIGLRPVAMPTVVGPSQPVATEIRRKAS